MVRGPRGNTFFIRDIMYLAELYKEMRFEGDRFSTWWIPMMKDGKDYKVKLSAKQDENGHYYIDVKEE